MSSNNSKRVIRASEIGEYSYCSRAWWYKHIARVEPSDPAYEGRLAGGVAAHARHGRAVTLSTTLRAAGLVMALCGLAALTLALLLMSRT